MVAQTLRAELVQEARLKQQIRDSRIDHACHGSITAVNQTPYSCCSCSESFGAWLWHCQWTTIIFHFWRISSSRYLLGHVYMHSSPVHKSLRGSFLLTTYTLWFHHKPQSSYAKSKNQRLCLHDINSVWRITAGDESWLSFFESGSRGHAWKQRPCSSFSNIQESWTVNWSLRLKLSTRKEEE